MGVIFQLTEVWAGGLLLHFLAPEGWDCRHGSAHPFHAVLRD